MQSRRHLDIAVLHHTHRTHIPTVTVPLLVYSALASCGSSSVLASCG